MEQLLNFSGFPEPFTRANTRFYRRWEQDMVDRLIREDIRDLTQIMVTKNIESLFDLIPEQMGSPLSLNSLKRDLEVSYTAVKSAVSAMRFIYIFFFVPPYSKTIARTLKKKKVLFLRLDPVCRYWQSF